MRFATPRFAIWLGGIVLALTAFTGPASAQTEPPGIDHYLVYRTAPVFGPFPVTLADQWMVSSHSADPLDWWANPVSKNGSPIFNNGRLHYTWWRIPSPPHSRDVRVTNQFGEHIITALEAAYLLNPALKNEPVPSPPISANHYKCYRAVGSIPPRTVTLADQWGSFQAEVQQVEWFCNPTEKFFAGQSDPMVRPDAHLTCYRILPLTQPPQSIPYTFQDQFRPGSAQSTVAQPQFLCLPTFKHEIVPTVPDTWGRVKAAYR